MYDSQFKQNVIVISPVLFIRGDNVRQAEIALHKGSRATHPCQFCASGFSAPSRTLQDYKDFATLQYQQRPEPVFLPNRDVLGEGLHLKAIRANLDLSLLADLPVEILHTLLLGMTKYCFIIVYDNCMDNNHIESLTDLFRNYNSKAFNRNLTSSLTNFRSFVGRDYKIMVQLLPSLLQQSRLDNARSYLNQTVFESIFNCFNTRFSSRNNSGYTKAHFLVHLSDDVEIFAGGPHTEAGHYEQQHKFMRELLYHTNRHNGPRDVVLRFSEEYMLRHMCQGGSFIRDSSAPMYEMCSEADVGLAALFRNMNSPTNGQTLGRISQKANGYYFVEAFEFVPIKDEHLGLVSIFSTCATDLAGNFVTRRLPSQDFLIEDTSSEDYEVLHVFDMSQMPIDAQIRNNQQFSVVNKSHFGTLWWLHNTTCR
ncbi:uncharacterized protein EV154DRAFT_583623 [Mucor mucedo]|uniref:uncharacterized protein n=1 Tax=Mucor mucedo TaxID=29922 RepID=UPI002220E02F|nr:uncharacterized protein EV154DRAFT_583623 [Mucor mucedo]KAI7866313.1 hypothetical protein EV154DRAFT_583623 [Mucor mucedo]